MGERQLARVLGISVGKTHYAIRAVLDRGWVKAQNFRRSDNRSAYLYKLTPSGLQEKGRLAYGLLQRKRAEHQALMAEIEQLRGELQGTEPANEPPPPQRAREGELNAPAAGPSPA